RKKESPERSRTRPRWPSIPPDVCTLRTTMHSASSSIGNAFLRLVCGLIVLLAVGGQASGLAAPCGPAAQSITNQAAAAELEEGIRLYSAVKYQDALSVFDRVITTLAGSTTPSDVAAIARAYEFRARTRFNRNDQPGAQSDFASLLKLQPDYKPD